MLWKVITICTRRRKYSFNDNVKSFASIGKDERTLGLISNCSRSDRFDHLMKSIIAQAVRHFRIACRTSRCKFLFNFPRWPRSMQARLSRINAFNCWYLDGLTTAISISCLDANAKAEDAIVSESCNAFGRFEDCNWELKASRYPRGSPSPSNIGF